MLRIPHCLDNQLTDGSKVVSPMHRPHFTTQKYYFSASGTHFCRRPSKPQGLVRLEDIIFVQYIFYLKVFVLNWGEKNRSSEIFIQAFLP
jgi:hypothetical protein